MPPNKLAPGIADESLLGQMRFFWKMLDGPKSKHSVTKFFVLIAFVIGANALTQVQLNNWQGTIYDAIGQRDLSVFLHEIGVFLTIVSILLCLGVLQTWLHERMKVKIRQAATLDLLDEWLQPARAFLLPLTGEISINPDQRIQEDTRRLSELSVDLAVGLVQSTLMLLAFVGVLWQLSAQVVFIIQGKSVSIPGYMVWAAIAYALVGSFITLLVGRPLISAHTQLRAAEAAFRFDLVQLNESAENIALCRGEAVERETLNGPVDAVLTIMRRIANRLATLTWVTGGYGWLAILAPLLLAAPGYFGGTLSLGGLMMVVGAFYQVQTALRWYVDRFPALAEWRAMLTRVIDYGSALERVQYLDGVAGHIRYGSSSSDELIMENLCVLAPNGHVSLGERFVAIAPGERVLIVAPPKSGKTTFIKALARLWVWGSGTIRFPEGTRMMFVPQSPYHPAGALKAALTYPEPADRYTDAEAIRVLERVNLGRLGPQLGLKKRWNKELTLEERWRLVLSRVLLHSPDWVIYDESIAELDDESRKIALSIFSSELAKTAVVSVGRLAPGHGFYQRTLKLQTRLPGLKLPLHFVNGAPLKEKAATTTTEKVATCSC
ncbi:MAG TPA: ABC transporter ATP-binding protein/permease [Geobacterales bacterium]|nr:ABC transporter ATP-binding protein/permease [Geobacterales bacterium]